MAKYEITIGTTVPAAPHNKTPSDIPAAQFYRSPRRTSNLTVIPKPEIDMAGTWVIDCATRGDAWAHAQAILSDQRRSNPQEKIEIISVVLQHVPASEKGKRRQSSSRLS